MAKKPALLQRQMHPAFQVTGSSRAGPSHYADLWLIGDNEEADLCSHSVRSSQYPAYGTGGGSLQRTSDLNFPFQSALPPVQWLAEERRKIVMYFLKNVGKPP